MTYRSLLVALDDRPACAARVDLAIALARRFDAHLAALAPTGREPVPLDGATGIPPAALFEPLWEALRERAHARAQAFRERCASAGLHAFEAAIDDDEAAAAIVRQGCFSDLIVIGQARTGAPGRAAVEAVVEQVVLHAARPVLVVPYAGDFARLGENILVAWNDRREAARALADAMPLLKRAKRVQVLELTAPRESGDDESVARLEALRRWLRRHGVDAEVHREATTIDVGEALLSRAADFDADLIVMGAYGHARWRERVLGGATRTLLATMTVPVLMSH